MHYASRQLSKALYDLTGLESGEWHTEPVTLPDGRTIDTDVAPKYSIGDLWQQLPPFKRKLSLTLKHIDKAHRAGYTNIHGCWLEKLTADADNPEDALAKLCILIRQEQEL